MTQLVGIQRRMMELGRVRMGGEKADGKVGRKLDAFRFTSASHALLEAVAASYGGTVEQWAGAPRAGSAAGHEQRPERGSSERGH